MAELLGTFELVVLLTVVNLSEGAYGRAILRGAQIGLSREVAAGAIYATLDRLEQKGLLSSQLSEGTAIRGGRAKRYYRLTVNGIKGLSESKAVLDQMWLGAKWPLELQI